MSSSTVTYTSIYTDSEPWRFQWVSDDELEAPNAAPHSPGQAPPSPDYVPGPEHPPSPDYVLGPEKPEQAPLSPDYVPEPEYPEYMVPFDAKAPIEDQPLLDDASPTSLSPGYVANSDPEKDPKEDPEEDPTDYLADGGEDNDNESSNDDDDDNEEQEAFKDDDEEEKEHPAPTDSSVVPVDDPISSAKDTETPMSAATEIPSPPLPVPSSPLPLPLPPTHTSPTYVEAPLGYKAAGIWLRAASPSTHHLSEIPSPPLLLPYTAHRDDILEAKMPLGKRARFSALASRFEVRESLAATAARKAGHALTGSVDYGFIDIVEASIYAAESRAMTAVGVANERVTDLATTQRQETHELQIGDTFARWLLLMSMRLLLPDRHGFTLRAGARPWRPRLKLYRGMSKYYRGRGLEMRTN
ncbi:hypothetical protein Tco_0109187 [Tanacetum coccineum]